MIVREISTRRRASWPDLVSFLRDHAKVKVIEDGYVRSAHATTPMLTAIEEAQSLGRDLNEGWRPWMVGTCGDQTAVAVSDYAARTRWLLPA